MKHEASQVNCEVLIEFAFAGVTTNQYNPVCGTDNQTYHNQERLDCARECGVSKYLLIGNNGLIMLHASF